MKARITKRALEALEPKPGKPAFLWDSEVTGFGVKALASGRIVYIVQYRPPTRKTTAAPKRLTLGLHGELTPDQARKEAAKVLVAVKAGEELPRLEARSKRGRCSGPTVEELLEHFLEEYLPNKKRPPRPSTMRNYEGLVRRHVNPALGGRLVAEITPEDVERLHLSMRKTPYLANRMLSVMHQAFQLAERWKWRPGGSNPVRHIERYEEARRGERKEVMLTSAQMSRLLEAIDEYEGEGGSTVACAAIRVVFWTGWRVSEVLSLEWRHLDLERGQAKLVLTKTARVEHRQIPGEAISVLREVSRVAGNPHVFPGLFAGRSLESVRKPWEQVRARAGLNDLEGLGPLRLHDLRHNVVSWDVSRGVPLEIAGRNVGHRSVQATEIYAHFAPDALKKAADARAQAMRQAMSAATTEEGGRS